MKLLEEKNPNGQTLFKIYELMEGNPSNRNAFQSQFNITKDQFKRFSDTVHNSKVSGDWARHASDEKSKTNNPMSKEEAKNFILNLILISSSIAFVKVIINTLYNVSLCIFLELNIY